MAHVWRKKYKSRNRILDKFYTKQEVVKRCLGEVNNKTIEYGMRVKRGSADWDRWINNYRKESDIFNRETE